MRVMALWNRSLWLVACGVLLFSSSVRASWHNQTLVEPFALGLSTTASTKFDSIALNPAIAALQTSTKVGSSTSQLYSYSASVIALSAVTQLPYNTVLAVRTPIKSYTGLPETEADSNNEATQTGTFSDVESEI